MGHETIRNSFFIKFCGQNRKERPNRSTNNGDIAETSKRYFALSEGVSD